MYPYRVFCFLVCIASVSACGVADDNDGTGDGAIELHGTLTQLAGAATLDDCPNGGVTLEHGIDQDESGNLSAEEVLNTYVLCHGKDGVAADTAALQAEIDELKAAVAANTAKVGYSDDLVAKSLYVAQNAINIEGNKSSVAAVSDNVTFNTTEIAANNSALSDIGSNAAFASWDKDSSDDFDGTYASLSGKPSLFGGSYADLTGAPAAISAAQIAAITANSEAFENIGSHADFEKWDKDASNDFDGAYASLSDAPSTISANEQSAIAANTAKAGFPGFAL